MSSTKKTPRDILRILFRRRLMFALTAAATTAAILVGSQFVPLQYTSTTVFERRVDAAAEELMKGKSESFASQKLTLQNELIGHKALDRVIDELHLLPEGLGDARQVQMARQAVEARLAASLRIDWRISSDQIDTVSLSYTDPNPVLAAKVPNALVQFYFEGVSEEIKQRLKQSCEFLAQRVADASKSLDEALAKRLKYQSINVEKYPEPGAYHQRIAQLTAEIQAMRPQLDLVKQRQAQLVVLAQNATSAPTSEPSQEIWGPNPDRKRIEDDLQKVQAELSDSMRIKGMRERHPYIVALRSKVDELQKQLEQTPQVCKLPGVYEISQRSMQVAMEQASAKAEIELLAGRLQQSQSTLDQLQARVADYTKASQEYADLLKVEAERTEDVKRWNVRLSELQMQLEAEVAQRATHQKTIQPARQQYIPSFPNLYLVLTAAILGGLASGGGLVFLASAMDRSFSGGQEVQEHLGLPVLGAIEEIVPPSLWRKRRMRRLVLAPAVTVVLAAVIGVSATLAVLRLRNQEKYSQLLSHPVGALVETLSGRGSASSS